MSVLRALAALGHAGAPARHALQPEHLAILVLQFVATIFSYGTLIQNFCDGTGHTTLPDSSLRSGYPCSGSRVQKAFYIFFHAPQVLRDLVSIQYPDSWVSCVNLATLLRLPLALLLPYAIYKRLTVAILFGARLTPMAVHLIRWRSPPPSYAAAWFLVINPATELFTYYANPCPSPLHEGTYSVISVIGHWVMAQYLCRDVLLQMGVQPTMLALRHALALCLTTYLALVWQRRARAGGAGGRGGGSGAAAEFMRGSSSSSSSHESSAGIAGKGRKGKTEGVATRSLAGSSRGLRRARAPHHQEQTVTAPLSWSEPTAASAAPLTGSTPDGSSAPNSSATPCTSTHSGVDRHTPATLTSSSPPGQASLTANLAVLRNSSSTMPTYRPFLQFRTTHIKIPDAHPSDLPPDFQQRLQQLLARSGQEGPRDPASQPGSSARGPTSHPKLHTVYVREGCIELLLVHTEGLGGVAAASGEAAEAADSAVLLPAVQGAGNGGGDSAAIGAGPSAVGHLVSGPDRYFVPASLYDSTGSGTGLQFDAGEVLRVLQLPGASSAQPLAHQEEAQDVLHSTPLLRVVSMSQQVLYIGASAGGVGGSRSSTAQALSLLVEVLLDRSSAVAQLEVHFLHQGRVLLVHSASFDPTVREGYAGHEQGPEWAAQAKATREPQGMGDAGCDVNRRKKLSLDIPIPEGMELEPGAALVEFRCGGRPVCVLPVLLTRQQGVAEEVGAAARAWQQQHHPQQEQNQEQEQQEQEQEQPIANGGLASRVGTPARGQLDGLLVDLGMWESHVYYYTQPGDSSVGQHADGLLYRPSASELAALGAHLLPYVASCGWCRTAEWIREGLGVLGEQQEEGKAQPQGRGQNLSAGKGGGGATGAGVGPLVPPSAPGASKTAAPTDSAERPSGAVARSRATGSVHCGKETRGGYGHSGRTCDGKERPVCAAAGPAGPLGRWLDLTPASTVEQGYQVFETVCLILLITTGGSGVSTTMLACGPGALVLLSRAFLTHGSWTRLLAAYRVPRYLCHIAYKVAAAAGWALDRPELLWGLGEAVYDGMLLPLCCPLPPRLAVPLMLANAAALTMLLMATGPPPPGVLGAGPGSSAGNASPLPAALVGLRLVVLGLATMATVHSRRGTDTDTGGHTVTNTSDRAQGLWLRLGDRRLLQAVCVGGRQRSRLGS